MIKKELAQRIQNLSSSDLEDFNHSIDKLLLDLEVNIETEQAKQINSKPTCCPRCGGDKIRKNGFLKNTQRFYCRKCEKNFSLRTGSAFHWLHKKDKLKKYLGFMLQGFSIAKCAKETGISNQTSFDWRHKILAAFTQQQNDTKLSGICESDDVFIAYSEKGNKTLEREGKKRGKGIFEKQSQGITDDKVAIMISCDRIGNKHLQAVKRGRISETDISKALKGKIEKGSILCTDGHRSFEAFSKKEKIQHKTIKVSAKQYVKEEKYHVQHVNQMAKDLKQWLDKFNGVSTKYLQNYLNWYALKSKIEQASVSTKQAVIYATATTNAWFYFKQISNTTLF